MEQVKIGNKTYNVLKIYEKRYAPKDVFLCEEERYRDKGMFF